LVINLLKNHIEFEIQYSTLLQALELQGKAPRTIAIYSTEIRKAFKYFNITMDKVSQDDLKKYNKKLIDIFEDRRTIFIPCVQLLS
jgi:hypothetical protein